MTYLIQGFTLGLAYVAPIGVQNLFVINTSITQSRRRALLTALIVMFFDITLAIGCYFGIGAIMSLSKWIELIILGIGSVVVIYIGIGLVRSKGEMDASSDVNIPILKVIGTACVVTWFNPQAIIDGSMLLGAFKASIPADQGLKFLAGVCAASASWWIGLSTIVSLFKAKISNRLLRIINIVCGTVIIFYGLKLAYSFVLLMKAAF